jgi:ADP-heptose:LPS heptosyltransferase
MAETIFLQFSRLGDCIQSTVLIATWRVRYPEDRIVVLTRPAFAPAFSGNSDIDELLLFNPPDDFPKIEETGGDESANPALLLFKSLKERKIRSIVNLTHDPFARRLATELDCETLRGLAADDENKPLAKDPWSLYLLSLLNFRNLNLMNLVDIYAQLSGSAAVRDTPRYVVDDACRQEIEQWLQQKPSEGGFIGFQPGANKPERRWPAENFIDLGRELVSRHRSQILVFGSRDEELLARSIADQIPNAQSFAGKTSIPQLAALLQQCKVLVTNDTGTMHMASAVGTRIVALFESSAFFRETGPYGPGHWIIQSRQLLEYAERTESELRAMQRIPVEHVLSAVDSFLSEKQAVSCLEHQNDEADHYRSLWVNGVIDYAPATPVPMKPEDLCARLQKPIWLALLNDQEVNPGHEAEEALGFIKQYYTEESTRIVPETLKRFLKDARQAEVSLLRLKDLVDSALQKLRINSGYCFSEDQLSRITSQEKVILQNAQKIAVQPFVYYFDIALIMVKGKSTRELFQNYRRHVILLSKQLKALQAIIQSALKK